MVLKKDMKFKEELISINASEEFITWVGDRDFETFWKECERGDWMLRYAMKSKKFDLRTIVKAKAKCASLVKHLMKDERSLKALEVAEKFGNGEATIDELKVAYADAADAVVSAATSSSPSVVAYSAASTTAYVTAYVVAAASAADDSPRTETLSKCADICREVFRW